MELPGMTDRDGSNSLLSSRITFMKTFSLSLSVLITYQHKHHLLCTKDQQYKHHILITIIMLLAHHFLTLLELWISITLKHNILQQHLNLTVRDKPTITI